MRPAPTFNVKPAPSRNNSHEMRCKKDIFRVPVLIAMRNLLQDIDACKGPHLLLLKGSQEDEKGVTDNQKNSLYALTRLIKFAEVKGYFHQLEP